MKGYFLSEHSIEDIISDLQLDSWKAINNLSIDDFENLFSNGILSSSDKILVFDILSLFNSLELNFNRIIGLNSLSCGGLGAILNEKNIRQNSTYQALFETDESSKFKEILQTYLEVRNLIAHSSIKKHNDTDSMVFFSANKTDWSNSVKRRKKESHKFSNRIDSAVTLSEMGENQANFAVLCLPFLDYLRGLLIPIDLYYANYAGEVTGQDLSE